MRLKSAIWVSAYLRRCQTAGIPAVLRRRGAEDAGAIFIKVDRLDGTAQLYGPAPQTAFDGAEPPDRRFVAVRPDPTPAGEIDSYLARQLRFDPDLWIVETEDRDGRHQLDELVP